MNPYRGLNFFEFFQQVFIRLGGFLTGKLGWADLATDEVQLLVLLSISISAAIVGSFLILKKMTMLANSISHTILLGIVGIYVLLHGVTVQHEEFFTLGPLIGASLVMGILTAYLTQFLTTSARIQEDASTGLVFTTLFALGIILVSLLTKNAHIGAEVVMGNMDALQKDDLFLVLSILLLNLICVVLFYKEYVITTFDSVLAHGLGISPVIFTYLLMSQVSLTVVGAFRAVGVVMVLALITAPPLIARFLTHDLKKMILLASLIGILASFIGIALARHLLSINSLALSTAGIVVATLTFLFFITLFGIYLKKRIFV